MVASGWVRSARGGRRLYQGTTGRRWIRRQVDGNALCAGPAIVAYFWADNPGESGTPAGHWMSVVAGLAGQWHWSPERTVEAYALTAIAVADAFIGCWREKYRTDLLRPVTYIQRYLDPKWETLLNTPPFPTYPSGHSTQSAAEEAGQSRFYGGIHFRMDHDGGKAQGSCIGRAVLARVKTRR